MSIAKILMPQLTSDRLFQIKTPLSLNKSKAPNGTNDINKHGVKKQNTIDLLSKKENIPEEGRQNASCIFQ